MRSGQSSRADEIMTAAREIAREAGIALVERKIDA
jgi:hypothetical protein